MEMRTALPAVSAPTEPVVHVRVTDTQPSSVLLPIYRSYLVIYRYIFRRKAHYTFTSTQVISPSNYDASRDLHFPLDMIVSGDWSFVPQLELKVVGCQG